jgi:beta-phosphoglucomutase-like phosphatase (HAD superfamily)
MFTVLWDNDGVLVDTEELYFRASRQVLAKVDIAHRRTGPPRFLDFVITNEDYQHSKPHPAPYLTALDR